MQKTENQNNKPTRALLIERMQGMYPERSFAAENGADGEFSQDALEQALMDALDEYANYQGKNKELHELLMGDPRSIAFVTKWMESGDPRAALVEVFGDDLSELATEEGRGQFSENLKVWREKRDADDKLDQEAAANLEVTFNELDSWRQSKGLSEEEAVEVFMRLSAVAMGGLMNKYSADDFDMAYKAMRFDNAVSDARREGEVAGRNARIEENKARRKAIGSMPPTLSGQGVRVEERKPKKAESVWAGVE